MTTAEFLRNGAQGVALLDTVTLHDRHRVFPGAEEKPAGGFLFAVEERIPCTLESGATSNLLRLRRIRPDGSVSMNPADLAYRWEASNA
jgi:hypothetical protein